MLFHWMDWIIRGCNTSTLNQDAMLWNVHHTSYITIIYFTVVLWPHQLLNCPWVWTSSCMCGRPPCEFLLAPFEDNVISLSESTTSLWTFMFVSNLLLHGLSNTILCCLPAQLCQTPDDIDYSSNYSTLAWCFSLFTTHAHTFCCGVEVVWSHKYLSHYYFTKTPPSHIYAPCWRLA